MLYHCNLKSQQQYACFFSLLAHLVKCADPVSSESFVQHKSAHLTSESKPLEGKQVDTKLPKHVRLHFMCAL